MTLNGAIMQLVEMRENSMMPFIFKPYFDKVIETVSECVEPSEIPQWIPCNERLPEKDGNYIVTDDSGGMRCVNECLFIKCDDGSAYWSLANVIAWMPLPEPYGGESDA